MKIRVKPAGCALGIVMAGCASAGATDISGDWTINSSVGGRIPITVHCMLVQLGQSLSGTCTPEMDNPESSDISGSVDGAGASWGYDVVFNGNPGTVEFQAETITDTTMEGTLTLSGTPAPFTAVREAW